VTVPVVTPSPSSKPASLGAGTVNAKIAPAAFWALVEGHPGKLVTKQFAIPARATLGSKVTFHDSVTEQTLQARIASYDKKCAAGNDASVPPRIDSVLGKIESGGFVVVQGDCFGAGGDVEIVGLPQGLLKLTAQSWQHDSVTAAIPPIAGAYPQKVNVELDRSHGGSSLDVSNVATVDFWPALDERTLSGNAISNSACPGGDCSNGLAHHLVFTEHVGTLPCVPEQVRAFTECALSYSQGDDVWKVAMPGGWSIESIGIITSWGSATVGSASPTTGTFAIHWQDANCEAEGCSTPHDNHPYAADYSLTVTLVGPVGTWH
jgi:hypothetical protein